MSQENHILSVYNTLTGRAEDVAVSETLYNGYRRGIWRIKSNDRIFHKNVIAFSELIGECERFREFRSDDDDPARLTERQLLLQELFHALALLPEDDRALLYAVFEEGRSERDIAAQLGVSQKDVNRRKRRLIIFLKNFLI